MADIPGGTGLGSSGSFTTALLKVLHASNKNLISPAELAARAAAWSPKPRTYRGGYETLYVTHVQGADVGADLDFLVGRRGADVPRESH